ncbi:MAG TPA: DNA repair protein RecO [Candidatus Paceibacterota bacterium]
MASYYRTQGVVLAKEDRGEADRLFTVFTKDFGKLRLRAVSERKITSKLRGGLELFYCSEIAFVQGRTYKTITDTVLLESFPKLRADIQGMRVMNRVAEIADEIIKGQEQDQRIWNLLGETFWLLNRPSLNAAERNLAAYYFLWNLLDITGYGPSASNLAKLDQNTAWLVEMFLRKNVAALQSVSQKDINERLLKEISQEYLSKVLQN